MKTAPASIAPILSIKKKKLRKQVNPFEFQRLALTPINNEIASKKLPKEEIQPNIYDHDVPDYDIFDNGALELLKF